MQRHNEAAICGAAIEWRCAGHRCRHIDIPSVPSEFDFRSGSCVTSNDRQNGYPESAAVLGVNLLGRPID